MDVAQLTTLAVRPDGDPWSYVERAVEAGATVEEILEDLLAPAARRLGDMWRADECDFLVVTTATHRLQTAVRRLSMSRETERQARPRALLAPAPGEAHTLGLAIVRALFEENGWSADLADSRDLEAAVSREWWEFIAFSINCDRYVDALAEAVALVRKASRNRRVLVLVGGPPVASNSRLAARIGADAGVATPHEAIVVTRSLIRRGVRL
jgi:methanogenic corrinoid protein MtbC1